LSKNSEVLIFKQHYKIVGGTNTGAYRILIRIEKAVLEGQGFNPPLGSAHFFGDLSAIVEFGAKGAWEDCEAVNQF
jgi:hypothetical protein